eukprot:1031180-Prorocentrum_lima.AAC.1
MGGAALTEEGECMADVEYDGPVRVTMAISKRLLVEFVASVRASCLSPVRSLLCLVHGGADSLC